MSYARILLLFIGCQTFGLAMSQCSERGKFPNDVVPNCQGYTICIGAGSRFFATDLQCPTTSIFNHINQQCNDMFEYQCMPQFNCTDVGNYTNTDANDCKTYIACVRGVFDIVTARLIQCPGNTIFNAEQGLCVDSFNYECESLRTTTIATVQLLDVQSNAIMELEEFSKESTNGALIKSLHSFVLLVILGTLGINKILII